MVQVRQISKAEFWQLYLNNDVWNIVNTGDRIVGHSSIGMANTPDGYEVVWAAIP